MAEDRRFELLRGCPNTLSNTTAMRSPTVATVRDLPERLHGGRQWTTPDAGERD
jgi:hypothetical protein